MYDQMAELFKVFSDKNRIKIIKRLIEGETCGCTLINHLPISQPTLSYHLKMITNTGLAKGKKEGNWKKHFIDKSKIDEMITFLQKLKEVEGTCNL